MLNEKAIRGLLNASPEKRYKSFLNTVTDLEVIWVMPLIAENEVSKKEIIYAVLWPYEEFFKYYNTKGKKPTSMEIHEFLQLCKELDETTQFMVFPTDADYHIVTLGQLYQDILEHLEEIE